MTGGGLGDRTDLSDEAGEKLAAISRWIDGSYRPGLDAELVMRRRVGKIGNEFGEVLEAVEAWTGENPRKGVTGTDAEVVAELLDVAVAALGAVEHLTRNKGTALGMLTDKITYVYERAGLHDHQWTDWSYEVSPSGRRSCVICAAVDYD